MNTTLLLLTGAAFSVSGVLLLQRAWHARRVGHAMRRRVLVTGAWTLMALAFVPWSIATGADKGAAFASILFMLAGAALVLRAGFSHAGNGSRHVEREARTNGETAASGVRLLLRRVAVFLLAGPVAGAAAILLAAAMFAAWDVATGSAANRLAAVMLFVPLAWALLAMWAAYDIRLRHRAWVVCAFLLLGLAGTFLEIA